MTEKIAFFDMDGTILGNYNHQKGEGNTSWSQLAKAVGEDALEEKKRINERWCNNEIKTYPIWVKETLDAYKERGLDEQTFNSVIKGAEYNIGVRKAFDLINEYDINTVILTGEFKRLARIVKQELKVDHFVAACEILWDDGGNICGNNIMPLDRDGKNKS